MKLEIELSRPELEALWLLSRGRQIRIVAELLPAALEDRAIAKVLIAAGPLEHVT